LNTNEQPVRVSQLLRHPAERVWNAITDHNELTRWYFENLPDFIPETGFSTSFAVHSDGRTFTHQWEIIEVIPFKQISYSWNYLEYPGNSVLTMKLTPEHGGTLLEIIHETTEDFPGDIPEFKRESCLEGWKYFLGHRLVGYLSQ
jgi:uncharacterized protein YndB with AHSA1/START domain